MIEGSGPAVDMGVQLVTALVEMWSDRTAELDAQHHVRAPSSRDDGGGGGGGRMVGR